MREISPLTRRMHEIRSTHSTNPPISSNQCNRRLVCMMFVLRTLDPLFHYASDWSIPALEPGKCASFCACTSHFQQ